MADQEVIKHTKKVYKIWTSKEHGFWHKAKEFMLEIFIIVFAVSLSIWLHGLSEHAHQQKDVKAFLLGLRTDLKNDLKEMENDRATFVKSKASFRYLVNVKMNESINMDSVNKHSDFFFNSTGLLPNNGRFEGFKSSGKIGTIENKELQNEIMDLYQENIPVLITYTNHYSVQKQRFSDYFNTHSKRVTDSTSNLQELLHTNEAYNMAKDLARVGEIVRQYDRCMENINKINALIDQEYKEQLP